MTRREFIKHTARAGTLTATSLHADRITGARRSAQSPLTRIKAAIRRDETILRYGGNGDNFHMTWAADDRQYVSVCDGQGWSDQPTGGWCFNSRLWSIRGGPRGASFQDLPEYPKLVPFPFGKDEPPRYYNFGTVALDSHIYQFLSTWNHPLTRPDGGPWADVRWTGVKVIYSADSGRTWCNQDGSTPVHWESWRERSRETLLFFEEQQEAFSVLSVLQMGCNYEQSRDGYVYLYAPNGNSDGTMNELVMFRAPKAGILRRTAYEYFAGLRADGHAMWAKDLDARAVVHSFPRGWVNDTRQTNHNSWGWIPSITYNAPLGLYMMASWGTGLTAEGDWFGKPSYLGLWVASHPWGPWRQIHEETAWCPGGDRAARAYSPQIAPKWVAADGKTFWLVWTDFQNRCDPKQQSSIEEQGKATEDASKSWQRTLHVMSKCMPYYAFNAQRVDLLTR